MQLKRNPRSRCQFPPLHPVPSASLFCCRPGSRTLNTKRQEWTQYTEIQKLVFKKQTNKKIPFSTCCSVRGQDTVTKHCIIHTGVAMAKGYSQRLDFFSSFFFGLVALLIEQAQDTTGNRMRERGGGVTHSKWSPGWDLNLGPTKPLYMGRPLYQLSSTVPEASVLLTEGHWFDP